MAELATFAVYDILHSLNFLQSVSFCQILKSLRAQPVDGSISVYFPLTFTSESRMIQRHINNKKQTETEIQKKTPQNYKKKYTQREILRELERRD